jgi:hypothetical protein
VLVMTWLDGRSLAQVAGTAPEPERARVAALYQRFLVSGPERAGLLHTDPHPGNFLVLPDGRLGVLDFGSSLELPGGMPATFGRLLRALLDEDPEQVLQRLREEGFVRPGVRVEVDKLVDYMGPFSVPARTASFRFSRAWLRTEFGRVNDPRNPDFAVALALDLPAEHLFTHRVWLGMVGVLCSWRPRSRCGRCSSGGCPVSQRWPRVSVCGVRLPLIGPTTCSTPPTTWRRRDRRSAGPRRGRSPWCRGSRGPWTGSTSCWTGRTRRCSGWSGRPTTPTAW